MVAGARRLLEKVSPSLGGTANLGHSLAVAAPAADPAALACGVAGNDLAVPVRVREADEERQ
eukprot:8649565-Pyramimonas_sp.AAC.1